MRTTFFAAALASTMIVSVGQAAIVFTLSPGPGGGVLVVGSGNGMTTGAVTTRDIDYADLGVFLDPATTGTGLINADTSGGTFTNITSGVSQPVTQFQVDRDTSATLGAPTDDVDFDTSAAIPFAAGDSYSLDLTATFDVSTLAFSSLIPGSYTKTGTGSGDEVFGDVTINIVPEPSTALLGLSSLLVLGLRRRQ